MYNFAMRFRRRRPPWLIPSLIGVLILLIWVGAGLFSSTEEDPAGSSGNSGALLAYLSPSQGDSEVYAWDFAAQQAAQLTDSGGVNSLAATPDGEQLVISVGNAQGGADLWRAGLLSGASQPLLDCGPAVCESPQVSPDGTWLAYQRWEAGSSQAEIFLLTLNDGEGSRASLAGEPGTDPVWATADSFSYYDRDQAAYQLMGLNGELQASFANQSGGPAAWHPADGYLVAAEQFPVDSAILRGPRGEASFDTPEPGSLNTVGLLSSYLMDYSGAEPTPLLDYSDPLIEDTLPVFSPDGAWLAFTRKYLDEERWTPGRQLWLLNLASGQLQQVTTDPNYQVIAIAWSPGSAQIAYVRANQLAFDQPLELWLTNLDGSASQLIAVDAHAPTWLP